MFPPFFSFLFSFFFLLFPFFFFIFLFFFLFYFIGTLTSMGVTVAVSFVLARGNENTEKRTRLGRDEGDEQREGKIRCAI